MAVTKKYGGLLQTIDSTNPQIDLAPSEKAVADYVDDSFESPTTLTISGPSSIDTSGGAGEADYQTLPTPSGAYGYKNVQVTCTDTKVTISDITKFGFHIAVAGFSSSADIVLNLSATKNDGTTITATKTVNVAVLFLGVGIKHTNGNIYSASEWTAGTFSASDALGVAISDGTNGLLLNKAQGSSLKWSSNTTDVVPDCYTTTVEAEANVDFAGKANTDAIIAAKSTISGFTCPAADWCRALTDGGLEWYLPAGGEALLIMSNETAVNECLNLIGGTALPNYFWTSTQYAEYRAWLYSYGTLYYYRKSYDSDVRGVAALS